MKEIYIFRHGETDWNAEGRFQGHIDIPLNDRGRAQARDLIPLLREARLEAVLSSDLSRALETAQIVAAAFGIPVYSDPGIREAFLGKAQGMTDAELAEKFPEILPKWRSNHPTDADISYPDGETARQVLDRTLATLTAFLAQHPFKRVGMATHGGVIRRLIHHIAPKTDAVPIPNCVLYRIGYDPNGRWSVELPA